MKKITWLFGVLVLVVALGGVVLYCHERRMMTLMPLAKCQRYWRAYGAVYVGECGNGFDARITFAQYAPGQERWPSVLIRIPRKNCDWRQVERLEFDAVSDHPDAYLSVRINNGSESVAYGRQPIPMHPVRIRINVSNNLSMKAELGEVSQLQLYQFEPERTCNIWLSNPRVFFREDFREYYQETHRQLALCPNPQKTLRRMDRKLMAKPRIGFKEWRDFHDELKRLWTTQFERQMLDFGGQAYSAIWVSPMEKVARTANPILTSTETLALDAARGEGESAQLVVYAKRDLKNLRVRLVKPLVSAEGVTIPEQAVSVMPVGYVDCAKPPYRTPYTGWWPDPLLAYADTIDLECGTCEPWWLDVNVPKEQSAGAYSGILRISADNAPETDVPFSVAVHRFTLPNGSAYPMSVCYHGVSAETIGWSSALPEDHPSKTRTADWNREVWEMMLAHRIGCDSLYHTQPVDAESAKFKLDRGARFFNICYLDDDTEKHFLEIDKAIAEYKRLGILDRAYFYGFDEAQPETFARISRVIHAVRNRYPGIPIFTTAMEPSFGNDESPLQECIDWWCPVSPTYEEKLAQIALARAAGRQVWWYICCYPTHPFANIFTDFPGLHPRLIMGMMYQKFKPDGFLYWAVTNWRDHGTLRNYPMEGAPCTNWTGNSFRDFNGDGVLVYPGKTQVLPTQRLKLLRDGMEDALYFQLLENALKNADRMPSDWRERAERELVVEPELVASLSKFTDEPGVLLQKRSRLMQLLDEFTEYNARAGGK